MLKDEVCVIEFASECLSLYLDYDESRKLMV